ncbi:30S ribosomal protein S2 [Patescibacteria group bacterium]|nr:30S ribosomal protein S2 [Patescibacteria group bacterium]
MLGLKDSTKQKTLKSNNGLEELLKAGTHFGYSRSFRHPAMKDFIFGAKNNIELINVEKTKEKLETAKDFLASMGKENKKILLVCTKNESKELIRKFAEEINMPYVNERWIGGILTNFKSIKERISQMVELKRQKETGEINKYKKKERVKIEKRISKLQGYFGGLEKIESLPSALIIIDSKKERNAVMEANKKKIPVIAIMNTDCDPAEVDYPIPANDNSKSSTEYLLKELILGYKTGLCQK